MEAPNEMMINHETEPGLTTDRKNSESDNTRLYFTFILGKELFGVSVNSIREVIKYSRVFTVPRTPEYIRGVINLRGEVVPVIDLYSRFYDNRGHVDENTSIIIVELTEDDEKTTIGVMIDSVNAVTGLVVDSIEDAPETGNRIRMDFIEGIGKDGNQFIILLDIAKILNIEELSDFI